MADSRAAGPSGLGFCRPSRWNDFQFWLHHKNFTGRLFAIGCRCLTAALS